MANVRAIVTLRYTSLSRRSGSSAGEPIMNVPEGRTINSGQFRHSLIGCPSLTGADFRLGARSTPRVEPGHPHRQQRPGTSPSREFAARLYPPSSASLCACPQLRRDGALLHHREVTLYAVRTDDEWIVLARLALERHQPRLCVGAVVYSLWLESSTAAPTSAATPAILFCEAMYSSHRAPSAPNPPVSVPPEYAIITVLP